MTQPHSNPGGPALEPARSAETPAQSKPARCPVPKWLRRFGFAGFMFFFIKGLVWLGLAGAAAVGLVSLK